MAYNFTKSDGTAVTVNDGSIDTSQFSVGLVGKNTSGYGSIVAQNFVRMVENFASNGVAPSNPTRGQLWYDYAAGVLKVYNGISYDSISISSGGTTSITGDLEVSGDIVPDANNTRTVGTAVLKYANIYATTFHGDLNGTASSANYADLAERYEADSSYVPGTVLKIGGTKEVTATVDAYDVDVFGVVSTAPAFLMNDFVKDDSTHPKVALAGRVPVRVVGKVKKGQRLVSSGVAGVAMAVDTNDSLNAFAVIGRALEDKNVDEEGLVLAAVGAK